MELIPNNFYIVEPLNPGRKHRDRIVIFKTYNEEKGLAKVQFVDNKRIGYVQPGDLSLYEKGVLKTADLRRQTDREMPVRFYDALLPYFQI